ncbi:hypothetical protein [Staphylococcus gallinarum]|uniref:hypothetical protein n=1 Tax=Staphylococcus gallinarum TaxID=1293 RepID=UPI00317E2599
MRKARMRIYDQRHQEWLELVARRTAQEVVAVMEADFLKYKNPIKMLDIVVKNENATLTLPLFVDSVKMDKLAQNYEVPVDEYEASIIEQVKDMLRASAEQKGFNQTAKSYLIESDYFKQFTQSMLPVDFPVIIEVDGQERFYPSSYNIGVDLTNEHNVAVAYTNFKVSYVFNDHALEQYSYLSEERKVN